MLFVRRFYHLDLKLLSILVTSLALIYIVEMSKNFPAYNLEVLPERRGKTPDSTLKSNEEIFLDALRNEKSPNSTAQVANTDLFSGDSVDDFNEVVIKQLILRQTEALRDLFVLFHEMETLTLKYGLNSHFRIFPGISVNETKSNEVAVYRPQDVIFQSSLSLLRHRDLDALNKAGGIFPTKMKFHNDTSAKMCFV